MPEGPEIRRAADRVSRVLLGKRAEEVWFAFEHLRAAGARLSGRHIEVVQTRGKAMLIGFAGGDYVYSHNQLYGRWYVQARGRRPRTQRQLRLAIHTERHSVLLYSASEIEVLRGDELSRHPFLAKLGPDVLDRRLSARALAERLGEPRFARRQLAGMLLDQGVVCGLGNYLRSEILFVAGLPTGLRAGDLDPSQRQRLAEAVLELSRRAYRTRGVTTEPDLARRLAAEGETRAAYRHYVFGREGRACRECGSTVAKETRAGRRIYWCPACQSPRRSDPAERAILDLLANRRPGATVCPSEVARALDSDAWRDQMQAVQRAARRLADRAELVFRQRGALVDPRRARGAVRLGLPES